MSDVYDYAAPVHRSLCKRDLIAGVSRMTLIVLMIFTYLVVIELHQYVMVVVSVIGFIVARAMTKNDEYLIDIVLYSLLAPDTLRP